MRDKKNKKAEKILIVIFVILLVLSITGIIFIFEMIKDSNRNSYIPKQYDSAEVIRDNYLKGFQKTKNTGKFSFNLNNNDINEVLSFATSKINDKNINSIYYEERDNHHYFYVDLTKILFVGTRVVLDTYVSSVNSDQCITLSITSCTVGKLNAFNFIKNKGYFDEKFISKIREYSCLPIYSDIDSHSFVIHINEFEKYSPFNGEISSSIFKEAKNTLEITNLFGFSYDFSSFRNSYHIPSQNITEEVDIASRFKESLTEDFLSTLELNETKQALSFSLEEFNNLFRNELNVNDEERYTSSISNQIVIFKVSDIQIYLQPSFFVYNFLISLNNYEIDFSVLVQTNINQLDPILYQSISFYNCRLGEKCIVKSTSLYSYIAQLFKDIIVKVTQKYNFVKFQVANNLLSIDFVNIINGLDIDTIPYLFTLRPDFNALNKIVLEVRRVI